MKKKVQNKIVKKTKTTSQELVIKVQQVVPVVPTETDLAEPMRNGVKLTIPKTWVSSGQLTQILQTTPKKYVYQRPGKGGGKFDYVTTSYVTKALNYIFGWNWDFEIVEHGTEGNQVWVKGRLTVRGNKPGEAIVKTQFGRNDIKMRQKGGMLDFGNDLKGAASDALKKCASMLGIASDIYGKADYKEESGKDVQVTPVATQVVKNEHSQAIEKKPGQVDGADGYPTYICQECDAPIGDQEAEFSMKMYGKRLCREDQANAKKK